MSEVEYFEASRAPAQGTAVREVPAAAWPTQSGRAG